MSKSLFDKNISPKCEYCATGIIAVGGKEVLCRRNGVMQPDSCCKKFRYDPLKRVPAVMKIDSDYSEDDFKL